MVIFGIIGLVIISIAVWIRKERKQDRWFIIGSIFLLLYSIGIHDVIFIVLQLIFMASALVELLKLKKRK